MSENLEELDRAELVDQLKRLKGECQQLRAQLHDTGVFEQELILQREQLLQAQYLLEKSRDRYLDLYEFAPVSYVTLDAQGVVVDINLTGAQLLEVERSSILGKPLRLMIAEEDRSLFLDHMRRCRQEEGRVTTQLRLVSKFGRTMLVELLSQRTVPPAGPGILYRSALTDLTERVKAGRALQELNEQLQRRTAEAEQAAEKIRQLASEITQAEQRERQRLAKLLHDHLQQWLIAAKLHVGVLDREGDQQQAELIEKTLELLDECLRASRSLTVELSPPVLHDRGFCAALEWLGRWMHEQHQLEVELELDKHVEPQSAPLRVLLFEAVRELLLNVVKHAGVDRAAVHARLLHDDMAEIVVEDWGVGFDRKNRRRRAGESSCFGLSHLQHRLELLGGDLEIESTAGQGTWVRLHLPLSQSSAAISRSDPQDVDSAAPAEQQSNQQFGKAQGGVVRVLLAEDHRIVREGLVMIFQRQPDIELVGEAADGEQAVELARQLNPDVVVMDVSMPRLNGLAATQRIRSELPHVQVIGLSLHEEEDMAAAMREAGAVGYLTKGGPSEQLCRAIREACSAKPSSAMS